MDLRIFDDKAQAGRAAADAGAQAIRDSVRTAGEASIVVATGASQFDVVERLAAAPDINWPAVTIYHLDEYVGLPETHPASFRKYLRERLIGKLPAPPRSFHEIDGEGDVQSECERLNRLIGSAEIAVAFVGIGENGHLAFNDPPADFETDAPFIIVNLDEACRKQQLGEGWFASLEDVPKQAISMSIRQIMKARKILCTVTDTRKAHAVKITVEGPVTPDAPASILQDHPDTTLYMDPASAALLTNRPARNEPRGVAARRDRS